MEHRERLLETLEFQRAGFDATYAAPCPFYASLCDELRDDVVADGPVAQVLAPYADQPFEAAYVLRLLGGAHRMALTGESAALAAHFPSTDGDGDARAAMEVLRALVAQGPPPRIADALARPPQTNEVGRAAALVSGLLVVAAEMGLPLRLREMGSSGGLNLRLDAYWYAQDGRGWGSPASPVRFVNLWHNGSPPFDTDARIVERRGCDRDPIDVTTDDGAMRLLSYTWPEPRERFDTARVAVDLARDLPVAIDQADVLDWLSDQLDLVDGTTLVLYHSVMWQYLDAATQAAVRELLAQVGARANADAPLAWVRLEPHPETYGPAELRITVWDGERRGEQCLLATTGFHGGILHWQ